MATRNRTAQLHFWITRAELDRIRATAAMFDMKISEYVRYVLALEVEKHENAVKGRTPEETALLGGRMRARLLEHERSQECPPAESKDGHD